MRKHTVHEYTLQLIYNPYGWILSFYLCNLQDSVKLNLGFSSSRVINSVLNVSGWNMNVQCCMHAVHGNESIPLSISCSALQLWSPWTKQLCSAISFPHDVPILKTSQYGSDFPKSLTKSEFSSTSNKCYVYSATGKLTNAKLWINLHKPIQLFGLSSKDTWYFTWKWQTSVVCYVRTSNKTKVSTLLHDWSIFCYGRKSI